MLSHAKDVLWAADYERRRVAPPSHLKNLFLNAEMIAHGIEITPDGSLVRFQKSLILQPQGCPACATT